MNVPPLDNKDLKIYGMIKYYQNLSPIYKKSLLRYTTSEYSSLNTHLRDGLNPNNYKHIESFPNEIDWIKRLDKVVREAPKVPHPFHVYRGMVLPNLITDRIKTYGYLNNLGYTSTSLDIHTARGFAGDTCCIFKVVVTNPSDINYVYIKTRTKGEQEILFQRGTHFRLVSKPYKYKYYPKGSNKYQLISLYTVTIKPGILVPTHIMSSQTNKLIDPREKILTSFARYIEEIDPKEIGMLYSNSNYINEMVEEYIQTHPHYDIDKSMKNIMISMAEQMI